MPIVPPGGFAGFSQMTPASKASWFRPGRAKSGGGRRRKARRASARTGTRTAKRSGRLPKFGSRAWRKKFKLDKKR